MKVGPLPHTTSAASLNEALQYVEFAGLDGDDDLDADELTLNGDALGLQLPNPNAAKANAQQGKPLEVLLATKNKRILEELTKFRVRPLFYPRPCAPFILGPQILHGELEAALQSMEVQLSATESELEKQRALNEKLETDLLQMDQRKADGGLTPSHVNGSATPVDVLAELGKKTSVSAIYQTSDQAFPKY